MSIKRRSLLKSLLALPLVVGFSGFVQRKFRKTVVVEKLPEHGLVYLDQDNFPEARIDMYTGKLYVEVDDKELLDTNFVAKPKSKLEKEKSIEEYYREMYG